MNENERFLREQLVELMDGRHAHADADTILGKLSFADLSRTPEGAPKTLWEVFEHIRIAQKDIVEFSRDPEHVSPEFPDGYWPAKPTPENAAAWQKSVRSFREELETMKTMVRDPELDLYEKFPHGEGQTLLREAMLVADHNAYHFGQMVLMMKMLKLW